MKRIVTNCHGGWVFEASDPVSFSEKVLEIKNDSDRSQVNVENAYDAAMEKYNWENEAEKLIHFYNSI